MVKTLESLHLLLQLFDKLCIEKYKTMYVKAACASLPGEILNSDLDIDMSEDLKQLVTDPACWKCVASMSFSRPSLHCA